MLSSDRQVEVWPVAEVLRQPAFWAMAASVGLSGLVGTGLMFHHLHLLAGQGLSSAEAAVVFLPVTLAGAGAALVAGRIADRVPPRHVVAAGLVLLALAGGDVLHNPVTGNFTFTPKLNWFGSEQFEYTTFRGRDVGERRRQLVPSSLYSEFVAAQTALSSSESAAVGPQ